MQQRAVFVAREDMSPVFQIAEAVVGSLQNDGKLFLIAQTVVIVDKFVQQILCLLYTSDAADEQ